MTRTALVLGPAGAGKTALVRALADEHPDHDWHLVRLEPADATQPPTLDATVPGLAGLWRMPYRSEDILIALPHLFARIDAMATRSGSATPRPTIAVFQAAPDPLLRHALPYNLRVFVMPPIDNPAVLFRDPEDARLALQQIRQDSTTFADEVFDLAAGADAEASAAGEAAALPSPGVTVEMNQSQVREFLAQPLGLELAARVHLQPAYGAVADADILVLNAAAGPAFCESNLCWQRLLALLARLYPQPERSPLTYACDLSDAQDPCFVRIRRRMEEALCRIG